MCLATNQSDDDKSESDESEGSVDVSASIKKKPKTSDSSDPEIKRMRECLEVAGLKQVKDRLVC